MIALTYVRTQIQNYFTSYLIEKLFTYLKLNKKNETTNNNKHAFIISAGNIRTISTLRYTPTTPNSLPKINLPEFTSTWFIAVPCNFPFVCPVFQKKKKLFTKKFYTNIYVGIFCNKLFSPAHAVLSFRLSVCPFVCVCIPAV